MTLKAGVAFPARAELGEGPVWDEKRASLWWLDLSRETLHRSDQGTGRTESIQLDRMVGSIGLRVAGGLIAAIPGGFGALAETGEITPWVLPEVHLPRNRMNDGKVAPDGTFWAGSTSRDGQSGAGGLYRLRPDRTVETVLTGLGIANGIGWHPDGRRIYFVDTATQALDLVTADGTGGWTRTTIARIDRDLGVPDGLAVDADGNAWVAMCFGGRVRCYSPDGVLCEEVRLPASLTTSVAFGGPDLSLMFVTTGRADPDHLSAEPDSGSVFVVEPGVRGALVPRFTG